MTEEIKPIKLSFSITLERQKASYDTQNLLQVKFEELVPANYDEVLYAKKRIKEEIDRQKLVIDSHAPKPQPIAHADPLAETSLF